MRLEDVAELMTTHGRRMSKATLSQVENTQRRIDVDDLMVFARVLKVSPLDLLLPPSYDDQPTWIKMTGFDWATDEEIADWMHGNLPLSDDADPIPEDAAADDWSAWYRVDRLKVATEPERTDFPHRGTSRG